MIWIIILIIFVMAVDVFGSASDQKSPLKHVQQQQLNEHPESRKRNLRIKPPQLQTVRELPRHRHNLPQSLCGDDIDAMLNLYGYQEWAHFLPIKSTASNVDHEVFCQAVIKALPRVIHLRKHRLPLDLISITTSSTSTTTTTTTNSGKDDAEFLNGRGRIYSCPWSPNMQSLTIINFPRFYEHSIFQSVADAFATISHALSQPSSSIRSQISPMLEKDLHSIQTDLKYLVFVWSGRRTLRTHVRAVANVVFMSRPLSFRFISRKRRALKFISIFHDLSRNSRHPSSTSGVNGGGGGADVTMSRRSLLKSVAPFYRPAHWTAETTVRYEYDSR